MTIQITQTEQFIIMQLVYPYAETKKFIGVLGNHTFMK